MKKLLVFGSLIFGLVILASSAMAVVIDTPVINTTPTAVINTTPADQVYKVAVPLIYNPAALNVTVSMYCPVLPPVVGIRTGPGCGVSYGHKTATKTGDQYKASFIVNKGLFYEITVTSPKEPGTVGFPICYLRTIPVYQPSVTVDLNWVYPQCGWEKGPEF